MTRLWRGKSWEALRGRKSITMNRKKREKDLTQISQRAQRTRRRRGNGMRVRGKFGTMMIAGVLLMADRARAQEMQMPAQEQHHQMHIPAVKPEYPRMGRAQENARGALVTLEQVQKIAGDSNPTLRHTGPETRAPPPRQQPAALYPH